VRARLWERDFILAALGRWQSGLGFGPNISCQCTNLLNVRHDPVQPWYFWPRPGLSYVGLGAQRRHLLAHACRRANQVSIAPAYGAGAGFAIILTGLGLELMGDGLATDALDTAAVTP